MKMIFLASVHSSATVDPLLSAMLKTLYISVSFLKDVED